MTKTLMRCAIYTRVSSDQGLEQDFNSLDAQREAGEAYIKSQAHEGWTLHRKHYDDGGFSGGSMERPALQELLADLANGRIDVIVVYKVDRLTRSLADFAKLVEIFDANKVSFVSVTQSFNTTSSMGRLTLNVLLSFAQFEREVTGERIRDKIAASKKKGIWMGGVVPLGYRVEARKLLVDDAEAETVRLIFRRYLELGSVPALQRDLREKGIRTRPRLLTSGKTIGGTPLTNGPLAYILRNRLYLGELNHHGVSYPSDHVPIVSPDLFDAVQVKMTANRSRDNERRTSSGALLMGRLVDMDGKPMSPAHTTKKGIRYRYYVSSALVQGRSDAPRQMRRLSASEVETIVLDAVRPHLPSRSCDTLSDLDIVELIDLRVQVRDNALEVSWANQNKLTAQPSEATIGDEERQRISVPYVPIPNKRRREIVLPEHPAAYIRPIEADEQRRLVQAIAQGREWLREVLGGATTQTIASREGKSDRTIRLILSLAFLDPKLVRAAILGSLPRGVSTKRLLHAPADWHQQWRAIGLERPA